LASSTDGHPTRTQAAEPPVNLWAPTHPDESVAEDITRNFFLRAGYKDLCDNSNKSPFGSRLYYRITSNGQRRALRVVLADSGFALPTGPIHRMSLRELRRLMPTGVVFHVRKSEGERQSTKRLRVPWEHVSRIFVLWTLSGGTCGYYVLDEDGLPTGEEIEMQIPCQPQSAVALDEVATSRNEPRPLSTRTGFAPGVLVRTVLGQVLFYKTHDVGRLGDQLTAIHFAGRRRLQKLEGTKWSSVHGIDGAYVRKKNGVVVAVAVVENKINNSGYSRRQLSVTTIRQQCKKLLASRHAKKREAGRIILEHLNARSQPGKFVAEIVRHDLKTGVSYRREVDEDGRPRGKRRKWNNLVHIEYWLRRRISAGKCELHRPT
jgi:hypothetical protein